MMEVTKRLEPTKETIRLLFAKTGNQCAFPGCSEELFIENKLVGEVCHITAVNEGGPRFDPSLTNEQRREVNNLIVLCGKHHKLIDADKIKYDLNYLQQIKSDHESKFNGKFTLSNHQENLVLQSIDDKLKRIEDKLDFWGTNGIVKKDKPEEEDFQKYFSKFLDDETDLASVFLKAQPTIEDCKLVFHKDYYLEMYEHYSLIYRDFCLEPMKIKNELIKLSRECTAFDYRKFPFEEFNQCCKTRELWRIEIDLINHGNQVFEVVFLRDKSNKSGISFTFWFFNQGRWVFFPKPNRVLRDINSIQKDADAMLIADSIKWMTKFKVLPKDFLQMDDKRMLLFTREVVRRLKNKDE